MGRSVMATKFAGINLAVWYGFALIAGALVLAIVYAWLCRRAALAKETA
jgi:dipeptide/tripeptide permease